MNEATMSDNRESDKGDQINVGNISNSSGIAIGRGASASVSQGLSGRDLDRLFASVYQAVQARPPEPGVNKEQITAIVREIQGEAAQGEQASPSKVETWLHRLVKMAPDIFDVTVASLTSPAAGIAAVIRKVAERVKAGM
jgi:hypothetical protein